MARDEGERARDRALPELSARFWALWAASALSGLGDGLNEVALPLLAATLTRRPALIAGVLFVERLPWLVVAIPAGAYADRTDRPRLMRRVDLVRGGLVAGLVAVVASGHMTIVYVYAFALAVGVCDPFFAGATQAVLPAIVAPTGLARANGLLTVGDTTSEQAVGPAVGGLLFAASRAIPFAVDAASFLGSAGLLRRLGRAAPRPPGGGERPGPGAAARSLWVDMKAGIAWYRSNPVLRLVTGTVAVLAFSQAVVGGILVLFVLERLHLDEVGYGLFMAGVAVGNVAGGLMAGRLLGRFATATVVVAIALLAAAGYIGAGAASSPYLAGGFLALEAVAVAVGNVAVVSFRQRTTPADLQARVANVWRSVVWGVVPLGALTGGALGSAFGLRVPFYVAGGLQLLLVALVARPLHRLMR